MLSQKRNILARNTSHRWNGAMKGGAVRTFSTFRSFSSDKNQLKNNFNPGTTNKQSANSARLRPSMITVRHTQARSTKRFFSQMHTIPQVEKSSPAVYQWKCQIHRNLSTQPALTYSKKQPTANIFATKSLALPRVGSVFTLPRTTKLQVETRAALAAARMRFTSTNLKPFHLAFPVTNIAEARKYYGDVLGLPEGRCDPSCWCDFNLFGNQIVAHLVEKMPSGGNHNPVDGDEVPVPHFGACLEWTEFEDFAARLKSKGVKFIIEPHVRFQGQVGEQYTMFWKDPFGNALEFKAMKHPENLFKAK